MNGDDITTYLKNEITSNIASLEKDLDIVNQTRSGNAIYAVLIYSSDADYILSKKYYGSISDIVPMAESIFMKENKLDVLNPDIFTVHLCVGNKTYMVPETLWDKYRDTAK